MKRLQLILIGAGGAILGLVVLLLSGVLNFAASSGHWDATDWVLDIAARQSVTLRSLGIEVAPLDDPAMIRRGAGHYEQVCAACHGSPARPAETFALHLTPQPPPLLTQMQHWRPPARTFWTIRHGIKRTAMPAWPTPLRDDEVWDLVAFIESMPSMSADAYRELAGDRRNESGCGDCHGEDGTGGAGVPNLSLHSPAYIEGALQAFRDGTRASGIMMSAASGLSDAEIEALAADFGRDQRTTAPSPDGSAAAAIWNDGIPDRDVPACVSCHADTARIDFPRIAGQDRTYLARQLRLFVDLGDARGGPHAAIMAEAVRNLDDGEIEALADWLAR